MKMCFKFKLLGHIPWTQYRNEKKPKIYAESCCLQLEHNQYMYVGCSCFPGGILCHSLTQTIEHRSVPVILPTGQ